MTKIEIIGRKITAEVDGVRIENVESLEVTRGRYDEPVLSLELIPDTANRPEQPGGLESAD